MKVLQLIYTSCKKGLSSGPGFQTYSMSEGITDEERREIERYGLYVPPIDLPTQPTGEEIQALFPVALRFFRLESGRFGICQSRYIGKDYSGRYGNYFCHALILEQGYFPVYPICFYNSPLFRNGLTESEIEINATPRPLPQLDSDELMPLATIHFDEVVEFINNKGIEPLKEMISAVIENSDTHRGLILCDAMTDIPYWIAAIQMAFPLRLAHHLTFATYTHDPAGLNIMVSGVPRTGSRFAFSETQRKFENYIFELDNSGPRVMDQEYEYIKNVDLGYTISRESLEEFHRFIDDFDFNAVNKELDGIDALFRLTRVGVENLTPGKIAAAVEFAHRYASPCILGQLSDSIYQIMNNLVHKIDFKAAEIIAKFLFKIARRSAEKKHLETAYTFFFQALDHLIIDNPTPNLEATGNFYGAVREENREYGKEFDKRMLASDRLKQITQSVSNSRDASRTGIYFAVVMETIITFPYTWNDMTASHIEFEAFIRDSFAALILSEDHLNGALKAAAKDKDIFGEYISFCLTGLITNEENRQILLNNYSDVMESRAADAAEAIRLNLIRRGHGPFIYEEFAMRLHRAPNKVDFFWNNFNTLFKKDKTFLTANFTPAVSEYLDLLGDGERSKECEKIIDYEEFITDPRVLQRVVEGFESGLQLLPPAESKRKKILSVLEIKKNRKISTKPEVLRLIMLGIECEKAGLAPEPVKITALVKPGSATYSLEDLNIQRVTEYFAWCSPNLLRLVKSAKDHETLFQWFGTSKIAKDFAPEYIAEISKIIREDERSGIDIFLNFLKFYLSTLLNDTQHQMVMGKNHDGLVKILAKCSKSQLEDIRTKLVKSSLLQEKSAKIELEKIFEEAAEMNKKSIFGQVKSLFSKEEKTK